MAGAEPDGRLVAPARLPARPQRSALVHDLRSALTVLVGRVQMVRRQSRQGDLDPALLTANLEAIEAALARLVAVVHRIEAED